jgi:hypothetical protein
LRGRQEAGVKKTYIVLIDSTIPEWIEWVLGRKAARLAQSQRRCPKCGNCQPLRSECALRSSIVNGTIDMAGRYLQKENDNEEL